MPIMFCHDCGMQFEDRASLMKHKKEECPAREDKSNDVEDPQVVAEPQAEPEPPQAEPETPEEKQEPEAKSYIKFEDCPKEVGLFAPGAFIGLKIHGIKRTDGGVDITDTEFVR